MPEQTLAQSRSTFPMPNVIGLTIAEAEKQVYSAGRSIGASSANAQEVDRRSDARPAGQIIQQLQPPGTP
jgi:beta-lactam-binding protein with PASTA domain